MEGSRGTPHQARVLTDAMAIGVVMMVPEHSGKELDEIIA
jgi:hypothetical protein